MSDVVEPSDLAEPSPVVEHYASDGITGRVLGALADAGVDRDSVDADVLASVDEFHLGGRAASRRVIEALRPCSPQSLLDVGSGIGGFARLAARELTCTVRGIDLTPEFVDAASELTSVVGLADSVRFAVGSATAIDVDDESVDAVTMLHVGMNVADKAAMAAEFARVLRPGGVVVIYDVMRTGDGEITYPVPWASTDETSHVDTPAVYRAVLAGAGFDDGESTDLTDLVLEGLARSAEGQRPPVHLGHLMGSSFPTMISNLVAALRSGVLAPTLITARRS